MMLNIQEYRSLKLSADIIAPSLLNIINISIYNGQFPGTLKEAKLLPINKGRSQTRQTIDQYLFSQQFQKLLKNMLPNICLDF